MCVYVTRGGPGVDVSCLTVRMTVAAVVCVTQATPYRAVLTATRAGWARRAPMSVTARRRPWTVLYACVMTTVHTGWPANTPVVATGSA